MNGEQTFGQQKKEFAGKAAAGLWYACLVVWVIFFQLLSGCQRPVAKAVVPLAAADTTLYGMFAYMADAAIFIRCSDGKRFPVVMEGKFSELERSYLQLVGEEAGRRVLLACHGQLDSRPAAPAEEGIGGGLRIDTVFSLSATLSCADQLAVWAGKCRWQQGVLLFLPCGEKEELRIAGGIPEAALRAAWGKYVHSSDGALYVELEGVRRPAELYPTRIRMIAINDDCQ